MRKIIKNLKLIMKNFDYEYVKPLNVRWGLTAQNLNINIMNFDNVGQVIMKAFDELEQDEQSGEILDLIDGGESDAEIKKGLNKAIVRLRELNREDAAKEIEEKIKGW